MPLSRCSLADAAQGECGRWRQIRQSALALRQVRQATHKLHSAAEAVGCWANGEWHSGVEMACSNRATAPGGSRWLARKGGCWSGSTSRTMMDRRLGGAPRGNRQCSRYVPTPTTKQPCCRSTSSAAASAHASAAWMRGCVGAWVRVCACVCCRRAGQQQRQGKGCVCFSGRLRGAGP